MQVGDLQQSFDAVAVRMRSKVKRHARNQRVPGMDHEDVESEMLLCLWKAWTTFDPDEGLLLEQWWWAIWINRKAGLIETYFAKKRITNTVPMTQHEIIDLLDSLSPLLQPGDFPECPSSDPVARTVWHLLASGYTGVEIRQLTEMGWRRFYRIIEGWRTGEVKAALTC